MLKGEIYRYHIKNRKQFEEYVQSHAIFLSLQGRAQTFEEFKKQWVKERGTSLRRVSAIVNAYERMVPGDYLWIRHLDDFALGQVNAPARLREGRLSVAVTFYPVDFAHVPREICHSFRGPELQRILQDPPYEQTKALYEKCQERAIEAETMKPKDSEPFEMEFAKEKGELVEVHPPMLQDKRELPLATQDEIRLSYGRKKREEPSFEMVIEMHAPKDLRLDRRMASLPMVVPKAWESSLWQVYVEGIRQQMNWVLKWQRVQFEMMMELEKLWYQYYLQIVQWIK